MLRFFLVIFERWWVKARFEVFLGLVNPGGPTISV